MKQQQVAVYILAAQIFACKITFNGIAGDPQFSGSSGYSFPACAGFNFHNCASDHKLLLNQESRLPSGSDFRRWVWITIAPFVTLKLHHTPVQTHLVLVVSCRFVSAPSRIRACLSVWLPASCCWTKDTDKTVITSTDKTVKFVGGNRCGCF